MAIEKKVLNVAGMSCAHCENRIKKVVGALDGVKSVSVDLKGKTVEVEFDATSTNLKTVTDTIEDQGYEVK